VTDVIKCGLYDYFELACVRRCTVLLELQGGETISGVASDLKSKNGVEFLLLVTDDGERRVNLMHIDVLVFSDSGERIIIS
jgi:transcriptional antiterminator Rof (Rho-off)